MPEKSPPGLNIFLDILEKLESLKISYVIIGGFAATIYGITRATHDIDIVVDLTERDIEALANAYPLPRYYADPYQMRRAIEIGSNFNIIDVERGDKADLFPITMDERYRPALEGRVRQSIDLFGIEPFSVWVARPEDVIIGKLMALAELKSQRHVSDIYEILVLQHLEPAQELEPLFNIAKVDQQAQLLGEEVADLWHAIKAAARQEADGFQS